MRNRTTRRRRSLFLLAGKRRFDGRAFNARLLVWSVSRPADRTMKVASGEAKGIFQRFTPKSAPMLGAH